MKSWRLDFIGGGDVTAEEFSEFIGLLSSPLDIYFESCRDIDDFPGTIYVIKGIPKMLFGVVVA